MSDEFDVFGPDTRPTEEEPETCGHYCYDIWGTHYGLCNMEPGHRGRHTTRAWRCDGCGKMRRSSAYFKPGDDGAYCFLCASPQMQRKRERSAS